MVLSPILPRLFMSPCPAIPTTRVENNNGAIIIFTIFKNMVARGDNFIENSGNNQPTIIPKNNAPNINAVNLEVFTIIPRKIIILQKGDFCFHLDINLTFLFH